MLNKDTTDGSVRPITTVENQFAISSDGSHHDDSHRIEEEDIPDTLFNDELRMHSPHSDLQQVAELQQKVQDLQQQFSDKQTLLEELAASQQEQQQRRKEEEEHEQHRNVQDLRQQLLDTQTLLDQNTQQWNAERNQFLQIVKNMSESFMAAQQPQQ
jgi:Mg2+ and Co2+ transporter CorA